MNLKLKIGLGVGLFLVLGILALGVFTPDVLAQEKNCSFGQEAAALYELQKNTEIGFSLKTDKELVLRREILVKVVGCGIDEANNLKVELSKVSSQDPNIKRLKERFTLELDQAINYYKINGAEINELNLLESTALAKKFLDWRTNNYQYTSGGVINLITWIGNQNFFKVAESRFDQVSKAVRFVSLNDPESEIPSLIIESKLSLDGAKKLNDEAWQALKGYGPPGKALELIKASLEKLSGMYEGFFKINEIITGVPEPKDPEVTSKE